MIKHIANGREYLLVQTPEDAQDFYVKKDAPKDVSFLGFCSPDKDCSLVYDCIDLPEGEYRLIGKASELTEEQTESMLLVSKRREGDFYHWDESTPSGSWYCHPDGAIDALCKSHGLKPEETVILQKHIEG
jgi:hypothetical protein